jgi:hypothetical protein
LLYIKAKWSFGDYHLIPAIKHHLCGHKFKYDRNLTTFLTRSLVRRGTDFYQQQKKKSLVPLYDKCTTCSSHYVRKKCASSTINCQLLLLELTIKDAQYVYCKLLYIPCALTVIGHALMKGQL